MGGAQLLLALAAVTVDYGWQREGDGLQYIIQIPPQQLRQEGEIHSVIDPRVQGLVTSVVVQLGEGPVPREDGGLIAEREQKRREEETDAPDVAPVPVPSLRTSDDVPIGIRSPASSQRMTSEEETVRGQSERAPAQGYALPPAPEVRRDSASAAGPAQQADFSTPPTSDRDDESGAQAPDPQPHPPARQSGEPDGRSWNSHGNPNGNAYSGGDAAASESYPTDAWRSEPGRRGPHPSTSPAAPETARQGPGSGSPNAPGSAADTAAAPPPQSPGRSDAFRNFGTAPSTSGAYDPRFDRQAAAGGGNDAATGSAANPQTPYVNGPSSYDPRPAPAGNDPAQPPPSGYAPQPSYGYGAPQMYGAGGPAGYSEPPRPNSFPAQPSAAQLAYNNAPQHQHAPARGNAPARPPASYQAEDPTNAHLAGATRAGTGFDSPAPPASPSDTRPENGHPATGSRFPDPPAEQGEGSFRGGHQPFNQKVLNGFLLISLVVNAYLGIIISKLYNRYRGLVASVRGVPAA